LRKYGPIFTSIVESTCYTLLFTAVGIVELYVYLPAMEMQQSAPFAMFRCMSLPTDIS